MLGKKKQVMSYPLLMKALNNSVKVLQKKYLDYGIPKNPTDAKKAIVYQVIHIRKQQDKATVPEQFCKYAKEGKTEVYIINFDSDHGGLNVVFTAMLSNWLSKKDQSVSQHVPDDGLHCAAILLDPKYCGTVKIIMSNKKSDKRAYQDQAKCLVKAFYVDAAAVFRNISYIAKTLVNANLVDGNELMDPNNVSC